MTPFGWRLVIAVFGILLLAATWVGAGASDVSAFEEALFRPVNDLPDWLSGPAWPVMQLGALGFVPVAAAVVYIVWRRLDLAGAVVGVGVVGWLAAKLIKSLVERGRPADLLSDVHLRPEWSGLGFVSGHAVIAFAIATVISPHLNRVGRVLVYLAAGAAGVMRMYTGAHLPFDIIGGMGLGLLLGALARAALSWGQRAPARPDSRGMERPSTP